MRTDAQAAPNEARQIRTKRNAQAIYQDLVDQFGFTASYDSVKRSVRPPARRSWQLTALSLLRLRRLRLIMMRACRRVIRERAGIGARASSS